MDRTPDEILAMTKPVQLFGDATDDPRVLRRAWAKLARRFRDSNPEVFQHARVLFETARDAVGANRAPPTPVDSGNGTATEATQEGVRRHETMAANVPDCVRAFGQGDMATLANVLVHDPGEILAHLDMATVLRRIVDQLGDRLTQTQLAAIRRELAHDVLQIDPQAEQALRGRVARCAEIQRVRQDHQVPDAFVDLLRACMQVSPSRVVRAVDAVVAQHSAEDRQGILKHLGTVHPGSIPMMREASAFLSSHTKPGEDPAVVSQQLLTLLRRPPGASPVMLATVLTAGMAASVFVGALFQLVIYYYTGLPQLDSEEFPVGVLVGTPLFGVSIAFLFFWDRYRANRSVDRLMAALVALGREAGLFPTEVSLLALDAVSRKGRKLSATYQNRCFLVLESDAEHLFTFWDAPLRERLLQSDLEEGR